MDSLMIEIHIPKERANTQGLVFSTVIMQGCGGGIPRWEKGKNTINKTSGAEAYGRTMRLVIHIFLPLIMKEDDL